MKKITLLLITLLITITIYSQSFDRVIQATKSEYINGNWKTIATNKPVDMFVIIKDWDITIGTRKFKTYDEQEKTTYTTHVCYSWKCIDSEGNKCIFLMKKFNPDISDHMLYSILYYENGIMFEYETE